MVPVLWQGWHSTDLGSDEAAERVGEIGLFFQRPPLQRCADPRGGEGVTTADRVSHLDRLADRFDGLPRGVVVNQAPIRSACDADALGPERLNAWDSRAASPSFSFTSVA